ncbi:MAG: hypothetical protein ABH825_03690 [Candidatus Omnitrophota bacterium]
MHKKQALFIFLGMVAAGLLLAGSGYCAPVGNPADPVLLDGEYPTKFSLSTDVVLKREMESESSGDPDLKGTFYLSKISLYLGNKLDLYGIIGTYDGKITDFHSSKAYILDSKVGAMFGLGASYVLREFECMKGIMRLGANAQYRQSNPDLDAVKYYRERVPTTQNDLSFKEWQVGLGLSYQYKSFVPYAGVKYSDVNSHIRFTHDSAQISENSLRSKNVIGVYAGTDFLLNDSVSFNIETRQLDEQAVNVGLNARF